MQKSQIHRQCNTSAHLLAVKIYLEAHTDRSFLWQRTIRCTSTLTTWPGVNFYHQGEWRGHTHLLKGKTIFGLPSGQENWMRSRLQIPKLAQFLEECMSGGKVFPDLLFFFAPPSPDRRRSWEFSMWCRFLS